jgi:hypothetical protein
MDVQIVDNLSFSKIVPLSYWFSDFQKYTCSKKSKSPCGGCTTTREHTKRRTRILFGDCYLKEYRNNGPSRKTQAFKGVRIVEKKYKQILPFENEWWVRKVYMERLSQGH